MREDPLVPVICLFLLGLNRFFLVSTLWLNEHLKQTSFYKTTNRVKIHIINHTDYISKCNKFVFLAKENAKSSLNKKVEDYLEVQNSN